MVSDGAARDDAVGDQTRRPTVYQTVVALFEDPIDTETALRAIERGASSPTAVSFLVRARDVDPLDEVDETGTVARSLVATALETVGGWLLGLATVIVAERGVYLVAGPLGLALAGITVRTEPDQTVAPALVRVAPDDLLRILHGFGFVEEQATYLEHRLAAGSALMAVTTTDPTRIGELRQFFADNEAVYITQGQTDGELPAAVLASLATVLRVAEADEVMATTARLQRRCGRPGPDRLAEVCGTSILDRFGEEAGTIDNLLTDGWEGEPDPPPVTPVRYVLIGFGGLLGLGRQHVPIPAALVDLTTSPARVAVERRVLHRAPRLAPDTIPTRREELAICAYFGVKPYWIAGQ